MNKAQLIITAIHVENLTQQEAAERYGVSQSWVSKLTTRFNLEGKAGLWDSPSTKTNRFCSSVKTSPHKSTTRELLVAFDNSLTLNPGAGNRLQR